MSKSISDIRSEYNKAELDISYVSKNPIEQFNKWLEEAITSKVHEPTAINLSTIDERNRPTSRIVLLKGVNEKGFVFFTNYESDKGKQIKRQPFVSLTFFWPELERQIRIEGNVEKVSALESDNYFKSRPIGSQIGAWASPQSQIIPNREILEENTQRIAAQLKDNITRPEHWGGYCVIPDRIEFWQGRASRLHDRIVYILKNNHWEIFRLAP